MENNLFNHIWFLMGDGTGRRFNTQYELLAWSVLQLYYLSLTLLRAVTLLDSAWSYPFCTEVPKTVLKNH